MIVAFWQDTSRLAETATQPNEASVRSRAQSLLTRKGNVAQLPTYAEALEIIAAHEKPTQSPSVSLPKHRAVDCTQQGDFTDADLCTHQNYRGY